MQITIIKLRLKVWMAKNFISYIGFIGYIIVIMFNTQPFLYISTELLTILISCFKFR